MKGKVLTVVMYILLALVGVVSGLYWVSLIFFNNMVNLYHGGILRYIFLLIFVAVIGLPILKYRKYKQKWVLPAVLIIVLLITPIFNDGIFKYVEDDLRIFSQEKWENYEELRIYMIDDLDTNYIIKGMSEEYVIDLLGEPMYVKEDSPRFIEYYISPGYLDPIRYYIMFEDGEVVETGKHHT